MSTEDKLASKADDMVFALSEVVHARAQTWQQKRDAVIAAARKHDLLSDLNEFIGWFGAEEIE